MLLVAAMLVGLLVAVAPASPTAAATVTPLPTPGARALIVDPDSGRLFVSNADQVAVFAPDGTLTDVIPGVPEASAMDIDGGYLYVGEINAQAVAKIDLTTLTPKEQVELYRLVPPKQAKAMMASGEYTGYRLGVAPNGIWHYFLK